AADAEAICEAVGRPTMRFVPVKTADQQAAVLLHRGRERLVRQRTAPSGHLGGWGRPSHKRPALPARGSAARRTLKDSRAWAHLTMKPGEDPNQGRRHPR